MNTRFDEIVLDIGNRIKDAADVEFTTAWLYVEAEEGVIAPDVYFKTLDNRYVYRFADTGLVNKVYELYTEFQSIGKPPWTALSFTLGQNNKFTVDFGYDDIRPGDEYSDARKNLWIKEHLGHVEIDCAE